MEILDRGWLDIESVYALAEVLRKKLRTSNMVERLNEEVKRRERVIRIFPNIGSIIRILGSILIDENEKWSQRKYLDTSVLKKSELERLVEVTEKQLATLEVKKQGDVIT
ncbi:transposase [Amygdalobacter nucleatus]|uniref:transposase n=1 Tax=Amygdalobacter nucleatus TaxID=3029274 RepID=UPI00279DAE39|nr:transposase [Amygdalobacter nucleatus]WEG37019.1 transposase [Amygdalobacter nucleatus]